MTVSNIILEAKKGQLPKITQCDCVYTGVYTTIIIYNLQMCKHVLLTMNNFCVYFKESERRR